MHHTFHIPVLGLGYSIDTPLKVAKYGISSVVSIVDDELTERMRKYHSELNQEPYQIIEKQETNSRSRRITAYLNLLQKLVNKQVAALKLLSFEQGSELCKYFELLPETSILSKLYFQMLQHHDDKEKLFLQKELKKNIKAGNIDVNIMSKVDKANYLKGTYLGDDNTDALAALRGFAESELSSSVVISAGLNPRLYSYIENFEDFYPDVDGVYKKKITLKVSDYRSAIIQAKVLAKKGLWVSEFRIESGLNCGGHAFATEGFLIGPILQEFKEQRNQLYEELFKLYSDALSAKLVKFNSAFLSIQKVSVQGGIGTAEEHQFLIDHYHLDAAGWGSPFLLVPEATNVDEQTLNDLAESTETDFYLSRASPLGIPFNNFRKSSAEKQRMERIAQGRPGSPCTKKFLCSNTEFTDQPICTASRKYQKLKISQLKESTLSENDLNNAIDKVTEKVCLCEGLCASTYLANNMFKPKENKAVSICPGPNLAYFSKKYSLKDMVDHIYGRCDLLFQAERPNLFTKELGLYIDYLKKEFESLHNDVKKAKSLSKFYTQLQNGITYYKDLIKNTGPSAFMWSTDQIALFNKAIDNLIKLNTANV